MVNVCWNEAAKCFKENEDPFVKSGLNIGDGEKKENMLKASFILTNGERLDISYSPAAQTPVTVIDQGDKFSVQTITTPAIEIGAVLKANLLFWHSESAQTDRS